MNEDRSLCLVIFDLVGGGAERVLTRLANHWVQQGWRVRLITFAAREQDPAYPLDDRVELIGAGIFDPASTIRNPYREILRFSNIKRLLRLRQLLREANPQAVISFLDKTNVAVLIATIGLRIPVIVSERLHFGSLGLFWNFLRRWTYPRAAAVVAQTKRNSRALRKAGFQNVMVIPNPISKPESDKEPPSNWRPFIIAVGRLEDQKDYPSMLNAFAKAKQEYPDWRLVILGEGSCRAALEKLASELRLSERVHFIGWTSKPGGFFKQAEIFLMTSRNEGFPNALCEAMLFGLPAICTNCPSGPDEIICDGKNGFLVPVRSVEKIAARLLQLIENPIMRTQMGADAAESIKKFETEAVMRRWDLLIDSVAFTSVRRGNHV